MLINEKLLNRFEAAQFIQNCGIPAKASTLAKYASIGGGPAMRKFGRRVLYEREEILKWIEAKLAPLHRSTSDK